MALEALMAPIPAWITHARINKDGSIKEVILQYDDIESRKTNMVCSDPRILVKK